MTKSSQAEAHAWMDTQDEALGVALSGLIKERHMFIYSARHSEAYRRAAYLRQLYRRLYVSAMIKAELMAEAYRQGKETRDVFPNFREAVTAVEDCFLSNLRSIGFECATRDNWP